MSIYDKYTVYQLKHRGVERVYVGQTRHSIKIYYKGSGNLMRNNLAQKVFLIF
jgi:hypothetical protein